MNGTQKQLAQPLAYRVWDPKYQSYFYTDAKPEASDLLERWTGLFDRQGAPIYENDIIRVHYNWRLGWVRALVRRHPKREEYSAQATAPDGTTFQIGFYCFVEAYRIGNFREHPRKLMPATEQFPADNTGPWWLSQTIFRSVASSSFN